MALSADAKNRLVVAMADPITGAEVAAAIDGITALASGQMIVGSAGGVAADVAISGDIAMANTGAATVNATKLASATVALTVASVGVTDLLAAAAATRQVIITVVVSTVFANGDGAQPTLSIGEESGSASKFAATTKFTNAAAGATFSFAGTLTSGKKLQSTSVAGTGTTETGAVSITAIAVG